MAFDSVNHSDKVKHSDKTEAPQGIHQELHDQQSNPQQRKDSNGANPEKGVKELNFNDHPDIFGGKSESGKSTDSQAAPKSPSSGESGPSQPSDSGSPSPATSQQSEAQSHHAPPHSRR